MLEGLSGLCKGMVEELFIRGGCSHNGAKTFGVMIETMDNMTKPIKIEQKIFLIFWKIRVFYKRNKNGCCLRKKKLKILFF